MHRAPLLMIALSLTACAPPADVPDDAAAPDADSPIVAPSPAMDAAGAEDSGVTVDGAAVDAATDAQLGDAEGAMPGTPSPDPVEPPPVDAGSPADAAARCGDGRCEGEERCESCPRDCGPCAQEHPVFFDAPMPEAVREELTCDAPWARSIRSTATARLDGAEVASMVGVDDAFAGIGASFRLRNNAHPDAWVDVLEPRSGAGAGWQTSFLVSDWPGGAGIIVFNQAAGNAIGYQWGYRSTLEQRGRDIYATTLVPFVSDHIHDTVSVHSPCEPSGLLFDDGAADIAGSLVRTRHGDAIAWRNRLRLRSRGDQRWPSWVAEQAFYLSRAVARAANLRLYLARGDTRHGPIAIYDPFDIPGAQCAQSFCSTAGYDYAVLVWNIMGLEVGVALPNLALGTSINLEQTTYCGDPSDDTCGNINVHAWLARGDGEVAYPAGRVRSLSQTYYVGTLPQLADLGFPVW